MTKTGPGKTVKRDNLERTKIRIIVDYSRRTIDKQEAMRRLRHLVGLSFDESVATISLIDKWIK